MADIQVDTPLGKTVREIKSRMDLFEVPDPGNPNLPLRETPVGDTIIALCDALEAAHQASEDVPGLNDLISVQEAELREAREENERLRGFFKDLVSLDWGGEEVTVDDLQKAALQAGLLRPAPGGYDPDKHGPSEHCDPGDEYYEWTEQVLRSGGEEEK